jgi:acetyl esterase
MVDSATELNPEAAAAVAAIEREGLPPWHAMTVEGARRVEDEVFAPTDPPAVERVREFSLPGPHGPVPVRTYHPAPDERRPAVVFAHGGGWLLGTLDSVDGICRRLADRSGRLVVSVDYRLAPENPFPAGLDDVAAAFEWTCEHAAALGGDPARVAVGGTSAGGNLAAAASLRAGDGDGPTPAGQLLLYPIVSLSLDAPSVTENADGPLLTREDVAWFREQYHRSDVDRYNPLAAPRRASPELLAGAPPACVVTAGFDPLRDDGAAYADRLRNAGVETRHDHYPAMPHGFLSLSAAVDAADEALDAVADRLRSLSESADYSSSDPDSDDDARRESSS